MKPLETFQRGLNILIGAGLFLLLWTPVFFIEVESTDPFRSPAEFLIVTLSWIIIALIGFSRAIAGKAIFGGGEGSWARRACVTLLAWCGVTSIFGYNPVGSLSHWVSLVSVFMLAQSVLGWMDESPAHRRVLVIGLSGLIALEVAIGLLQVAGAPLQQLGAATPILMVGDQVIFGGQLLRGFLLGIATGAKTGTPVGSLGNQNYLAELLVLLLPIALGAALALKRPWQRGVAAAALVPGLVVLAGTGTRSAWLGLAIAIPLAAALVLRRFGWQALWRSRASKGAVLVAGVLMVGVLAFAGGRLLQKLNAGDGPDVAIESRLVNWKAAVGLWADRPLTGSGIGTFKLLNVQKLREQYPTGLPESSSHDRFIQAHNEPLQALTEIGLIGVVLAGVVLLLWLREVAANPALATSLKAGLGVGVTALGIAGMFGFPLHIPLTALVLALAGALGLAEPGRQVASVFEAGVRRMAYCAVALGSLGIIGSMVYGRVLLPNYLGHRYEYVGDRLIKAKRFDNATKVLALADRHVLFKDKVRWKMMQTMVHEKHYEDALSLFDASSHEGIGMDCYYWKGRALAELGRVEEAKAAYSAILNYYTGESAIRKRAIRNLRRLELTPAGK